MVAMSGTEWSVAGPPRKSGPHDHTHLAKIPHYYTGKSGHISGTQGCRKRKTENQQNLRKHVLEKHRRDRINRSLEEMRVLLLNLTGNEILQNPKVEKTEILELTASYVQNVMQKKTHEQQRWVSPAEKCYLSGFRDCLNRTEDFIQYIPPATKARFLAQLETHLEHRLSVPKPLSPCNQVRRREEDLSSDGNVSPHSIGGAVSPYSPSVTGSETSSPPSWESSSSGGFQNDPNHGKPFFWRPWP
ncbi:transcription factor HES-7-like [Anomaloglossus baeobatrachus]|uniref:transcription factor HES-7-like n=1 Tax=Anomaloglossus baeobatrachus TaxID=238106 RepID=UPI003F501CEF